MSEPKDLSTLSPEELMEIAKLPLKEDTERKKLPLIKQFIIGDGLQEGEDLIPAMLVYDRFKRWCAVNHIEDLSVVKFGQQFSTYFTKIRKNEGHYYRLSQNGFDLSEESIALANSTQTAKRNSRGFKKTKKKKSI